MKEQLQKISTPEEIFVDFRETDIEITDPYKGIKVKIEDYVLLHSSTGYFKAGEDVNFLGLNRVFNEEKGINTTDRRSFWLKNSELFACFCTIFYPWIDEKQKHNFPDPKEKFHAKNWLEKLKPEVISINPTFNWYGFIVDFNSVQNCFSEDIAQLINSLREKGFSLKMLAENSFGYSNSANIYIQISANKFKQKEWNTKEDDRIDYYSLTLEKTNFKVEFGKKPMNFFRLFGEDKMSIVNLKDPLAKHSIDFISAITNFNLLFDLMAKQNLDYTAYNAILLDLYDRNRNEASVDLDDRLKNLMKKTIHKGHNITRENDQSYTWAHIIESVVRNNAEKIYSKVEKNPNDISHLFSKKMVVQKMERIYEAINSRNDKEIEINNYIKKQVDSYREVDHHLGYPFV